MLSIRKKKKKFRFRATKNFSARQFVTKISCRYVEERRYFDITGDCDLTFSQTAANVRLTSKGFWTGWRLIFLFIKEETVDQAMLAEILKARPKNANGDRR